MIYYDPVFLALAPPSPKTGQFVRRTDFLDVDFIAARVWTAILMVPCVFKPHKIEYPPN